MSRSGAPALSLAEWVVLCLVGEGPTYGFAVASLVAPDGELGHVWRVQRPVVYRALQRLGELGLMSAAGVESTSHGPARTVLQVTTVGDTARLRWLDEPVAHVRDVRSELMVKLALLDRAGIDPAALLTAQHRTLEPIAEALRRRRDEKSGFERTLADWRYEMALATLKFLDGAMSSRL
ncbi:PadR family transcriptional regulator [Actinomadura nitritigenes]|uniref:PadR family transcriptional regulator n=1 Tax=Actinomadura nitritigenes TaxID=134602 RepID=UPI003D914346